MASLFFLPLLGMAIVAIHYRAKYLETRDKLDRFASLTKREVQS